MIKKTFKEMLVTQIVSNMTVMLCMMVDSMMIGRFLGVAPMTAYGLASPVLLVFAAFGSMLSSGVQVMCGKTLGSGDREAADACFTASAVLAAAVSFGGLVLVVAFARPLCVLLGAGRPEPGNEVFGLTKDYLLGFVVGAPAFIGAQIMVPYMQISGNRGRLVTEYHSAGCAVSRNCNVLWSNWNSSVCGNTGPLCFYRRLMFICISRLSETSIT